MHLSMMVFFVRCDVRYLFCASVSITKCFWAAGHRKPFQSEGNWSSDTLRESNESLCHAVHILGLRLGLHLLRNLCQIASSCVAEHGKEIVQFMTLQNRAGISTAHPLQTFGYLLTSCRILGLPNPYGRKKEKKNLGAFFLHSFSLLGLQFAKGQFSLATTAWVVAVNVFTLRLYLLLPVITGLLGGS